MNNESIFKEYMKDLNPEHWRGFPDFMKKLGFEMDGYESAPYLPTRNREETEKDVQDRLLKEMENWTTQQVGNFIFSRYRELTHWCDYGYEIEKGPYFFHNAFPILERKLNKDVDMVNSNPQGISHSMIKIVRFCSENNVRITKEFHENNSEEMVFDRLERAVGNIQKDGKMQPAAPARFAIWAADVIDILVESAKAANNGDIARANELQAKAIKTMFAFKECMRLLDTEACFEQFSTQEEILERYK